jgi:hypothetical protein
VKQSRAFPSFLLSVSDRSSERARIGEGLFGAIVSIEQNSIWMSPWFGYTRYIRLPTGCKRKRTGKIYASRCRNSGKFLPLVVVALLLAPPFMNAAHGSSLWDTRRSSQPSKPQSPRSFAPARSPRSSSPRRYLENTTASPARSPVSRPVAQVLVPTIQPSASRVPSEAPLGITAGMFFNIQCAPLETISP